MDWLEMRSLRTFRPSMWWMINPIVRIGDFRNFFNSERYSECKLQGDWSDWERIITLGPVITTIFNVLITGWLVMSDHASVPCPIHMSHVLTRSTPMVPYSASCRASAGHNCYGPLGTKSWERNLNKSESKSNVKNSKMRWEWSLAKWGE